MIYRIFDANQHEINLIEADLDFVEEWCAENGYTFELSIPETESRITDLEAENKTLKSKLTAAIESNSMLEECLVEMAGVVYA